MTNAQEEKEDGRPLPSHEEYSEQLYDLIHLFIAFEEEDNEDSTERESMLNGIIHECDAMLRQYDPMREVYAQGTLPIDSTIFYAVYATALYELFWIRYTAFCMNGGYMWDRQEECDGDDMIQIQSELSLLIKCTIRQYKQAYTWSQRTEGQFIPGEYTMEELMDPEDINAYMIDLANKEVMVLSLLRMYHIYMLHQCCRSDAPFESYGELFNWLKRKQASVMTFVPYLHEVCMSRTECSEALKEDFDSITELISDNSPLYHHPRREGMYAPGPEYDNSHSIFPNQEVPDPLSETILAHLRKVYKISSVSLPEDCASPLNK